MAGTYANVPAARIAYDRDGSVGVLVNASNQATIASGTQMSAFNAESATSTYTLAAGCSLVIIFPQTMTITATFHAIPAVNSAYYPYTQVSTDTTNGIDGTWTQFRAKAAASAVSPDYRSNIYTGTPVSNIKAIRLYNAAGSLSYGVYCFHIYGVPDAYTGDKLVFWHPTLDQPLNTTPAYFDYGDVPQNSAAIERDFRLKNISSTLSANTITVSCEAPTDASPTYVSQTAFRYNGGSYSSTASIATLAPGAISSVLTAKMTVQSAASLSVWTQRYVASAANWS